MTALESQRRILGAGHPDTLNTLTALARARIDQRRYEDAEVSLREALSLYQKSRPDSWTRYRCESLLGASLAGQKKFSEAEPALASGREGLVRLRSTIPAYDQADLPRVAEWLAQLHRDWHQPGV